jgi:3-phenylpropionate/trans-cinnamate dioxygenase ferredoxin component
MSFERACAADEVREDEPLAVIIEDMEIAVARQGDEFFAIQDLCSHAEVALSEGDVEGCTIECWLHGSAPASPPACRPPSRWPPSRSRYAPAPTARTCTSTSPPP